MAIDKHRQLSRLLGALDFTVAGKHHRVLYKAMFCMAFHAFLRIGEMTVQSANATNPNLLQWKQLEIKDIIDSDRHSLQAQQRQAPDPNNERYHLTAGLPSSNHEGILVHARSFISVLPSMPVTRAKFNEQLRGALQFCHFCPKQFKSLSYRSIHYCCNTGHVR